MNKACSVALLVIVAGLAACSESTTAPRAESPDTTSVYGGGATEALTFYGTMKFSITIDPSRNTYYYLGEGNSLNFPAHSLCDPYRSSYGVTEWDTPCTPATWPVTVNVTAWMDKYGHARVDFDRHLRFVPTSNPAGWVTLQFADLEASLNPFFNILYCASTTGACTNEALTDPTLLTVRNPLTGKITRRIKHFSGYNVAAGREDGVDESSYSVSPSDLKLGTVEQVQQAHPGLSRSQAASMYQSIRLLRRSGYILASG